MSEGDERVTLSIREVAGRLGVSERHAWSLIKAGDIPSFRTGSRVLVSVDGLRAWVGRQTKAASG